MKLGKQEDETLQDQKCAFICLFSEADVQYFGLVYTSASNICIMTERRFMGMYACCSDTLSRSRITERCVYL